MNKEEIISGGFLAAHLSGELNPVELKQVISFLEKDSGVRKELHDLETAVEWLSFQYAMTPAPEVKNRVMNDISVNRISRSRSGNGIKWLLAASLIISLVSVFTAFYFWSEWKKADDRLAQITARNLELTENYHIVNQELADIRQDLAILVSPEYGRMVLEGTANAPDAKVVIYWNPIQEEIYLNSGNLASLPKDQQYQLWALIDGQPVDAGIFDAEAGTFQIMKGTDRADAFAVTIEPIGGSVSPTLKTMLVFSKNPDLA